MKSRFLPVIILGLTISALHSSTPPPEVKGVSVIVVDANSGEVLFQRNSDEKRPVGSTQKLMTSLIVAEQGNLDKEVVIQPVDELAEPTTLQLKPDTPFSPRSWSRAPMMWPAHWHATPVGASRTSQTS